MADETTRTVTTIFRADVSNFSKSTQDMNNYIKAANSEFKAATASMDRWSDSQDGLNAKLTQLGHVLTAEQQKLANMREELKKLEDAGKGNTAQAERLRNSINNQQATVTKTQKEIDHYTSSLNELADAGVQTTQDLDKLNQEHEELKTNAKELGGGILKGAVAGVAGIATACVSAVAGMFKLVEETKELRTQMGQLDTAFQANNLSAEAATQTYDELYGVLGDSGPATEASLHLAQLATDEKQLESLTNSLTGVYAQFGGSLPLESLAEGAQITASLGEVNGTMADALEFAGYSVDAFNEELAACNSEEVRAQLVTNKLNEIYGESAAKYKDVNGNVIEANKAQNEYNQTMADIATEVEPAVTSLKLVFANAIQTIFENLKGADIEGIIANIGNVINTLVTNVLPPLLNVLTWVLDNLNWLAPLLGSIIGLVGGIIAVISIYNTVMKIARTVQLLWNAALLANPIGLIIAAVAALVAAFVILWNKCDGFRNFMLKLWDSLKSGAKTAAEAIGGVFTGVFGTIKTVINGIITGVNSAIGLLNKIKIPDWEIFGEYAGKGINIKTIPKLARGGVVDSATIAQVGEAGKEAIVPLENNTEWINKLADKLKATSAPAPSNVTINQSFEKIETSRLAMHKAKLEIVRAVKATTGV